MTDFNPAEYRALMRADFALFVERVFRFLNPQAEYLDNWHIRVMAAQLDACRRGESRRLIVNVPPRSLKSIVTSVAFPAWLLGHNPSVQILCVSYAQDLSEKLSRDCLQVMQSDWYKELFPRTKLSRSKLSVGEFTTTANGFRKATSVEGVITGRGADFIVIDDPLKPDEAASEILRKRVNAWYGSTLISRQNNKAKGCIVLVMQRLHEEDLAGYVQETEPWDVLRFPAIAEEDEVHVVQTPYRVDRYTRRTGEALHPEREPLEALEAIRRSMGTYDFAAQYQQNPNSPTGGIIKRSWLKIIRPELWPDKFDHVIQSWDTANKATELANYSVGITLGIKGKNYFVLDVYRKRHEFPDLVRAVDQYYQKHQPTIVVVEEAASGVQLIQEMEARRIYRLKAAKPEDDKVMRLYAQAAIFEGGYVHLPAGAPWLDDYIRELTSFPGGKYADQVDATTQALAFARGNNNVEPAMLTFIRQDVERMQGLNQPDTPLKAPSGVTEAHTITGRKVTVDLFGVGWFTTDEVKYLLLDGWTKAPDRSPNIHPTLALQGPVGRRRVQFVMGRGVPVDDNGVGLFTEKEAIELMRAEWRRV